MQKHQKHEIAAMRLVCREWVVWVTDNIRCMTWGAMTTGASPFLLGLPGLTHLDFVIERNSPEDLIVWCRLSVLQGLSSLKVRNW